MSRSYFDNKSAFDKIVRTFNGYFYGVVHKSESKIYKRCNH